MNRLYEQLLENSLQFPEKTAVVCGQQRVSYLELRENVDCLAAWLSQLGMHEGSVIALVIKNSTLMVECFFAAWKLGAVAAPVNYRENDEGVLRLLSIARADLAVCEDGRAERFTECSDNCHFVSAVDVNGNISASLCSTDPAPVSDSADALYIFTSGTTGVPKAAVHTVKALWEFTTRCFDYGKLYYSNDVFLSYAPMCHAGGLRIMLGNLICGATLILTTSFDPEEVLSLISREKVTQMFVIPPSMVMRLKTLAGENSHRLESLRQIRISGGLCTTQTADTIFSYFGNITLVNGYGSSESAISLFNIFNRNDYQKDPSLVTSVGKPLPGCSVRLLDEDGKEISQPGAVGEAWGKCSYMFSRYISPDSTEISDEWFDTGDQFSFDEYGNYYFKGRTKDIIKTGGENVFAGEVEALLAKHPAVAECAVFKLPHETLGEAVSAAIVLKPGQICSGTEIVEFCRQNIASYKKPIKIFFVKSLAKTASGKVKKSELQEKAALGKL